MLPQRGLQALAACQPLLTYVEHSVALLKLRSGQKKGEQLANAFAKLLLEMGPRVPHAPPLHPKELVQVARTLTPALESAPPRPAARYDEAAALGVGQAGAAAYDRILYGSSNWTASRLLAPRHGVELADGKSLRLPSGADEATLRRLVGDAPLVKVFGALGAQLA